MMIWRIKVSSRVCVKLTDLIEFILSNWIINKIILTSSSVIIIFLPSIWLLSKRSSKNMLIQQPWSSSSSWCCCGYVLTMMAITLYRRHQVTLSPYVRRNLKFFMRTEKIIERKIVLTSRREEGVDPKWTRKLIIMKKMATLLFPDWREGRWPGLKMV